MSINEVQDEVIAEFNDLTTSNPAHPSDLRCGRGHGRLAAPPFS